MTDNSDRLRPLIVASEAGYFGSLVKTAIDGGWSEDTIAVFAKIAGRYANRAMRLMGVVYND
jgi:hypothetical protein